MGVYFADKVNKVYSPRVTKSTSRYKTKLRISLNDSITHIRFIRKRDLDFTDDNSTVHIVRPIEAYRPDVIANQYFGDAKYAWVILSANNLKTPYELESGMKLIIPSLASLQGSQGKLVTR